MKNIKEYGAHGDGRRDDFFAVTEALEKEKEVFFPKGTYIVSDTVRVPSDRRLIFEKGAALKLKATTPRKRGDFLLTNKNHETGDKNIVIEGAVFDGNNKYRKHKRPKTIFQKDGYSGILINFYNVENLTLKDITLKDPVSYFTRFCKINGFLLENIRFIGKRVKLNQDGIHFAGEVKNGKVKNVRAESYGQTGDDLLALNADDYLGRIEEFDTVCGTIENIVFEDVFAECCHDAVRLLSYRSAIKNITFKNLNVGFRNLAVDNNAARGCRAELFKEEDEPRGVGDLTSVTFTDCTFRYVADAAAIQRPGFHPMIRWGSVGDDINFLSCRFFVSPRPIKGIKKLCFLFKNKTDAKCDIPAFYMKNVTDQEVVFDGKTAKAVKKEDVVSVPDFCDLSINIIK